MSFTPEFTADAQSQWQALDFDLQELVLDELERVLAKPPRAPSFIADFVSERAGMRRYVFLELEVDHRRRTVRLISVGLHARPQP